MNFEGFIKRVIEDNCRKNTYATTFSPEFQKSIKTKASEIASIAVEDDSLLETLDLAIEDAIRIMILRDKNA